MNKKLLNLRVFYRNHCLKDHLLLGAPSTQPATKTLDHTGDACLWLVNLLVQVGEANVIEGQVKEEWLAGHRAVLWCDWCQGKVSTENFWIKVECV